MTPRLETPRLILRPFAPGDWDALSALLADPHIIRYMHFVTWTADQRRQWFEWCLTNEQQPDSDARNWAVTRKDSGAVIGLCHSQPSDEHDAAVPGERGFGYLLKRTAWNQGYMTEALRAVLEDEFGTPATLALRATCHVANPASARVLEKVGLCHEKTTFDPDFAGTPAQWHHYTITKADNEAQPAANKAYEQRGSSQGC
jgi:[ribosomal protein S5]-alanine N-acetyltransferase